MDKPYVKKQTTYGAKLNRFRKKLPTAFGIGGSLQSDCQGQNTTMESGTEAENDKEDKKDPKPKKEFSVKSGVSKTLHGYGENATTHGIGYGQE